MERLVDQPFPAFAHASTMRPTCCFGIVEAATAAIRRIRSSLSSMGQGSGPV